MDPDRAALDSDEELLDLTDDEEPKEGGMSGQPGRGRQTLPADAPAGGRLEEDLIDLAFDGPVPPADGEDHEAAIEFDLAPERERSCRKPQTGAPGFDATPASGSASRPPMADNFPAPVDPLSDDEPPLRIMALHALMYCERLFYLEEVEEIRVADAAVYAGRRLHEEVAPMDDESTERRSVEVASSVWGLYGKIDAVRRRDGVWVAYEHKRGRCRREEKRREAWPSDRVQAVAYAVLLEEELGQPVPQARIRYHADNVTVIVEVDEAARAELRQVVERARQLRKTTERPPIHENEKVCRRCSLNVVCLPEEERLRDEQEPQAPTLFPSDRQRQTLHIVSPKAYVSRSQDTLIVTTEDQKQKVPIRQIDAVVIHGHGQVTAQAIHLCSQHGVLVAWLTAGGKFIGAAPVAMGRVQQRLRQYAALADAQTCFRLARQLVLAKVTGELRYVLRSTRGDADSRAGCQADIDRIREVLHRIPEAPSPDALRGLEGMGAKSYFACLPRMLRPETPAEMVPRGRNKRPPRDRFNCLLGFGYALLQSVTMRSIVAVGLEPALGFFHRPRSAAHAQEHGYVKTAQ